MLRYWAPAFHGFPIRSFTCHNYTRNRRVGTAAAVNVITCNTPLSRAAARDRRLPTMEGGGGGVTAINSRHSVTPSRTFYFFCFHFFFFPSRFTADKDENAVVAYKICRHIIRLSVRIIMHRWGVSGNKRVRTVTTTKAYKLARCAIISQ